MMLTYEGNNFTIFTMSVDPKGTLVRKQGVLVHHGPTVVDFDIAGFIIAERDARLGYMVAEDTPKNLEHFRAI